MHHKYVAARTRVIVVIYTFEMCACRAERTVQRKVLARGKNNRCLKKSVEVGWCCCLLTVLTIPDNMSYESQQLEHSYCIHVSVKIEIHPLS